ncbi:winged helix-turn-helix domain-containing protein [Streptomyces sp. NPDC001780]
MDSGAFGGTQAAIGVEVTGTFPYSVPFPPVASSPYATAGPERPPAAPGWGDPGQGVGQGYGPGYGHDFGPGYGPPGPGAGPGFGPAPVTEAPEARATREPRATQPGSEAARESGQRRRRKQPPGAESGPGTSTGTRTGTGTGTASSAGQDASSPTGALVVDRRTRQVWVGETPVSLTPKEFDLLALLTEDPGAVYSRQQILDRVWDPNFHGPTKTLDVHVATLRRKLGNPAWIQTLRGVGLRLAVRVPASGAESPSGSPSGSPSASGMYTDSGSYAGSGTYSGSGTYTSSDYREKRAG